jgi:hypothetical protein
MTHLSQSLVLYILVKVVLVTGNQFNEQVVEEEQAGGDFILELKAFSD